MSLLKNIEGLIDARLSLVLNLSQKPKPALAKDLEKISHRHGDIAAHQIDELFNSFGNPDKVVEHAGWAKLHGDIAKSAERLSKVLTFLSNKK